LWLCRTLRDQDKEAKRGLIRAVKGKEGEQRSQALREFFHADRISQ
jgi:hypothetical protein